MNRNCARIIAGCCLLMTAAALPANCMGIFLSPVSKSLNIDYAGLSFYITIQYIVMIITMVSAGKLLTGVYMKCVMLGAALCVTLAFFMMSFAKLLMAFYVAGVLIGIGLGILLLLPVPLLINEWFNTHNGLFIGIAYLFLSAGAAVFNPLGGAIIQRSGWQNGYIVFAVIFICLVLPAILMLKHNPKSADLELHASKSSTNLAGSRYREGLRSPYFYMIFIFTGILGILPTLLVHLPTYILSAGLLPIQGASVLSAVLLGGALGKVLLGAINDKFGVMMASATAIVVGVIGIIILMYTSVYGIMLFAGFLFGIGYSCAIVLPPLSVKAVFGTRDYSKIYPPIMIASAIGSALGAFLIGYAYSRTASFFHIFVTIIALMLFALLMNNIAVCSSRKRNKV